MSVSRIRRSKPEVHRLSVVVPMYNEEGNVAPMLQGVHEALRDYPYPWELVVVNDCSTDRTGEWLTGEAEHYGRHVRIISLRRNFGQTAAMQAGIDAARGDIIATLDGDLQNDPRDIPPMVRRLIDEHLDLVVGWRRARQDRFWLRKVPSRIANGIIGRITGIRVHDYGCSLKIYRATVIKSIRLYGEMHRFIPAWVAANTSAARIQEQEVMHHPRQHGQTKYGLTRTFRVLLDLLSVYFFMRFQASPGQFFGRIGLVFGSLGSLALAYLAIVKFVFGQNIGTRPLLIVGVLLVVVSVQFLTTGVLSEMLSRTYFESSRNRSYAVRDPEWEEPEDAGWHVLM
jgi:glycosyltransferase involved in cell wall biosynthesis